MSTCTGFTNAKNPASIGQVCECNTGFLLGADRAGCVSACNKLNNNNYLDKTGKACVAYCGQYVGVYLNYQKTQCVDECATLGIDGLANPSFGGVCSCPTGQFLDLLSNKCLQVCSGSQYGDSKDSNCKSCHLSCPTCSGPLATNCATCADGKFLTPSLTCESTCPDG